jgi:hypothetical protein
VVELVETGNLDKLDRRDKLDHRDSITGTNASRGRPR